MKELYAKGNHICVAQGWLGVNNYNIIENPDFEERPYLKYYFIHNSHRDILQAFFQGRKISARLRYGYKIDIENFIEQYNPYYRYIIEEEQEGVPEDVASEDLVGLKAVKKECQFKKYGFEVPDFECEILGRDKGKISAIVTSQKSTPSICIYDFLGACYEIDTANGRLLRWSLRDLKPIKKEWYEHESNFPCLVVDKKNEMRKAISFELKTQRIIFENELYSNICNGWRLATKEEVLSLYKEVK